MTDIDFDELDRAVNSLTAKTPSDDNSSVGEASSAPQTPPAPTPPSPPVNPSAPPLAARRSPGRFMDMVRPTSARPESAAPERVSRVGTTIGSSPAPGVAPSSPEIINTPPPAAASPDTPPAPVTSEWPDPLDFHGFTSTDDSQDAEDDDIDKISADITNSIATTDSDLPDSPFITNAKVEKRPLGAFSNEPQQPESPAITAEPTEPQTQPTPSPDDAEPAPQPQLEAPYIPTEADDVDTPLPAELQDDLLSIESSTATQESAADIAVRDNEQPIGPTSITQQYKEQPSSGEKASGAIYDTSSYHKALVKPAKKKSGWMWVIWITLLLVVGAGAGAAVYYFVLPLL
ncbi:MAG TPA: hypothetical protein VFS65_02590 [Candidatus Saccharimonadales bacterium]|nr:hypothetical protein [Candidatus Saccharimonadales bacterium]